MNKELKKKWVSELRSGKYKQGKGLLRSGDKHCCLGVFCEIAAAAGVGKWIQLVDRLYFNDGKDDGLSLLPSGVMDFGGITQSGSHSSLSRRRSDTL